MARATDRTHPAISHHINRLESELGIALLERQSRGVTPTQAGMALWQATMDGLGTIASGVRRVEEIRDGSGSITIATGGTTVRHFLKSSIVRFRRTHPNIGLDFEPSTSSRGCIEAVRRGTADLGLVTLDERTRGVEQRAIATQSMWLLVPPGDPLFERKRIHLSSHPGLRLIGLPVQTTSGSQIEDRLQNLDSSHEIVMRIDDFDTAAVFVELGLGCAIVPAVQARALAQSKLAALQIMDIEPLTVAWAARRWSALSASALRFDEVFRAELRRMARSIPGLSIAKAPRD